MQAEFIIFLNFQTYKEVKTETIVYVENLKNIVFSVCMCTHTHKHFLIISKCVTIYHNLKK